MSMESRNGKDYGALPFHWNKEDLISEDECLIAQEKDMVNSPAHYTQGRFEAIDVIEDAIEEAPSSLAALCHGNALKYLLRLWHKVDAKEDAMKAQWYLTKLIDSIE